MLIKRLYCKEFPRVTTKDIRPQSIGGAINIITTRVVRSTTMTFPVACHSVGTLLLF